MEFGFPPLQHLCDIALARFNCHLALAAPHTLHSIIHNSRRLRGSDPNPASLEQCTRAALIRLHRPLDYDQFFTFTTRGFLIVSRTFLTARDVDRIRWKRTWVVV